MFYILFSYLIYNFIVGIALAITYLKQEKRVVDTIEFLNLLFFPANGLGKWKYNHSKRFGQKNMYPRSWYIFKHMIQIHWGYVGCIIASFLYFISSTLGLFNTIKSPNNAAELTLTFIEGIGAAFLGTIVILTAIICISVAIVLFIGIPRSRLKTIENSSFGALLRTEVKKKHED